MRISCPHFFSLLSCLSNSYFLLPVILFDCRKEATTSCFAFYDLRLETERLGWVASDVRIRTNLGLERFYQVGISLPDRKKQETITDIFSVSVASREINEKLKSKILAPFSSKVLLEESFNDK